MNSTSCHDDSFGPVVHGCRDDFDFTLLFENTILSIAPSAVVLLFSAARIFYLRKKPNLFSAKGFQLSKLVCSYLLQFWQTDNETTRSLLPFMHHYKLP